MKWIVLGFNSFYFGKYFQGHFGVALADRYVDRSKVFLRLRLLACFRRKLIIADADAKSYPLLLYLFKLIWTGQSLSHERLKSDFA